MKRGLVVLALTILSTLSAFAQGGIHGTVADRSGEPLPGVGVILDDAGSKGGVMTDIDGKFTIDVPVGATLMFSSIGFKTVTLAASDGMHVVLEEDRTILDEAVVIGYGTVKKKDLLGSVSTVREQALQDRKSGGVISSMQGLVPGVNVTSSGQPGSYASIQIRGIGSLTGNAPLFIVDGSYGGNELGLNVEDIESIQVLKDASSASIYGSRATTTPASCGTISGISPIT